MALVCVHSVELMKFVRGAVVVLCMHNGNDGAMIVTNGDSMVMFYF